MIQTRRRPKIWQIIIGIIIGIPVLFFVVKFLFDPIYSSTFVGGGLVNDFIKAGVAGDVDTMSSFFRPEVQQNYTKEKIQRDIIPSLVDFDHLDLRKSGFGTVRRGPDKDNDTMSVSAYAKYKNTSKDRNVSASFMRINGKWWMTSFSIDKDLY